MKKGFFYILILVCCGTIFSGCLKNGKERNVETSMTADIGTYAFSADNVQPSTITPQMNDSSTTLIVTGTETATGKKIMISVLKYTNSAGTYSIADKKAVGSFTSSTGVEPATSGFVTIKDVSSNAITGYFSLTTVNNVVTNGAFVVGKPWNY